MTTAEMVAAVALVALLFPASSALPLAGQQQLDPQFYDNSCPQAQQIMASILHKAYHQDSRMAASLLRLHFHDCFLKGSDASVLLESRASEVSEKPAGGLAVVDEIKAALEAACPRTISCADVLACPRTVSCADILALALAARHSTMSTDIRPSVRMAAPVPAPSPGVSRKRLPNWAIYVGVATGVITFFIIVDVTLRCLEKSARRRGDHEAAKRYEQMRKAWEIFYHATLAACRAAPYVAKLFE